MADPGRENWHFQTTHYDLRDYDVPAEPALADLPDDKGGTVPAVAQVTKPGYVHILDRRTRVPIEKVVETPVRRDGEEGAALSPTRPLSVGMPPLGGPLSTAGGVSFYAGTQDYLLRVYDTASGELGGGRSVVPLQLPAYQAMK